MKPSMYFGLLLNLDLMKMFDIVVSMGMKQGWFAEAFHKFSYSWISDMQRRWQTETLYINSCHLANKENSECHQFQFRCLNTLSTAHHQNTQTFPISWASSSRVWICFNIFSCGSRISPRGKRFRCSRDHDPPFVHHHRARVANLCGNVCWRHWYFTTHMWRPCRWHLGTNLPNINNLHNRWIWVILIFALSADAAYIPRSFLVLKCKRRNSGEKVSISTWWSCCKNKMSSIKHMINISRV